MKPSKNMLHELDTTLSQLTTVEAKAAAVQSYLWRLEAENPASPSQLSPGRDNPSNPLAPPPGLPADPRALFKLFQKHGLDATALIRAGEGLGPQFFLERIPCAYIDLNIRDECFEEGTLTCSQCKLVRYCSKACQKKHWKIHRADCKDDPIRSSDWQPVWVLEDRPPIFISGGESSVSPLSVGCALWGNMPAVDILKLSQSELRRSSEVNIAFAACGDLRNVIQTVNGLPVNFSGKLTVVMNDLHPFVTLRNVIMLQILGSVVDKKLAADVALHFWYSAFVPAAYHTQVLNIAAKLLDEAIRGDGPVQTQLAEKSTLVAHVDHIMQSLCRTLIASCRTYQVGDAANELSRVRFDPSRVDLRHRQYCRMEASHRLAHLEFHRFGIVLPFGAHNAHFNTANHFLFGPEGKWVLPDGASPLEGWDMNAVMQSGKAHGASREDVYGCLYFHVTDQLRAFAERLGRLDISFTACRMDAVDLAKDIRHDRLSNIGIRQSIHFDRIDVSNIMDKEYLGISPVLDAWGPLLKRERGATLLGYFMNWASKEPGGELGNAPEELTHELTRKAMELGRIPALGIAQFMNPAVAIGRFAAYLNVPMSLYDNSEAFEGYLDRNGFKQALRQSDLKRKLTHTLVPHRICAPYGEAPSALPEFKDHESWYFWSAWGMPMWSERYLEITCS